MASSKTEICNLALSHIGISKEVGNIDTENSASANACRRFFDDAQRETYRDFNWPFANKYEALGLVIADPNTNWAYSYRYPSAAKRIIKLLSGVRNDSRQSRVPYEISSDASGRLIFTDQVNACAKFTQEITDVSIFPQDYVMMLSLLIASYIAPRVTAGDPFKLGERAFRIYTQSKTKAEATAFNEQQDDQNVESEFIRSRET